MAWSRKCRRVGHVRVLLQKPFWYSSRVLSFLPTGNTVLDVPIFSPTSKSTKIWSWQARTPCWSAPTRQLERSERKHVLAEGLREFHDTWGAPERINIISMQNRFNKVLQCKVQKYIGYLQGALSEYHSGWIMKDYVHETKNQFCLRQGKIFKHEMVYSVKKTTFKIWTGCFKHRRQSIPCIGFARQRPCLLL
jgi:hypothetical protein